MSGFLAAAPSLRLPKSQRIRRSAEYRIVTGSKPALSDRFFVVYSKQANQTDGRLGVTVSRRVSAKAVDRNKIKRAVRESFRVHQVHNKKLDVVAIARRDARSANPCQLRSSLERHWRNLSEGEQCAE